MLAGLMINLIASILISYDRIFRSKKTIEKESITDGHEEKHRLIAQVGAVLLAIGFAIQIWGTTVDSRLGIICKDYFVFTISIPRPWIYSSFL
jgi:hypothetical protein